jgi:hypothetical protein
VRVVAYVQRTYEIEVGRDRVEWTCSVVTYTVSGVNDVALYEVHAGNIPKYPWSTFIGRSCRKPIPAVPWWTLAGP